jgi:hypothetical protein
MSRCHEVIAPDWQKGADSDRTTARGAYLAVLQCKYSVAGARWEPQAHLADRACRLKTSHWLLSPQPSRDDAVLDKDNLRGNRAQR